MDRLKNHNIGVIGLGAIGIIHSDVLSESSLSLGLSLVATADPSPQRTYPGRIHFNSYRHLLSEPSVDAVSICTPPDTHYPIAIQALNMGKHVLVEKPPALTIEQLDEMEQLAQKSGVVLFTALHANYPPEVQAAKKELNGIPIDHIEVNYREDHSDAPPGHWLLAPDIGGAIRDSAINAVSLIRTVMGADSILSVQNARLSKPVGVDVETKASIDFTCDNVPGKLEIDWFYQGPSKHQVVFQTSQGVYIVDQTQGQLIKDDQVIYGRNNLNRVKVDQNREYREVYRAFAECLKQNKSFVSKEELRFVLAAYKNSFQ